MLRELRLRLLLHYIAVTGGVEIGEAAAMCSVSEMTARRDLAELARRGAILRVHGGAVRPGEPTR
jgi:DeoR/GlpR family transcriptional regulator of sugar metabolism